MGELFEHAPLAASRGRRIAAADFFTGLFSTALRSTNPIDAHAAPSAASRGCQAVDKTQLLTNLPGHHPAVEPRGPTIESSAPMHYKSK